MKTFRSGYGVYFISGRDVQLLVEEVELGLFGRRNTDALPGVGGADQRRVHELQAAFFGKEARYGFRTSSLFDKTPFNEIGGAYVFSVSPGDA